MMCRQGLAVLVALGLATATAGADELGESARRLVEENKNAVVTLQLLLNSELNFGGQSANDTETVHEVVGTVISEDGLIVTSLLNTDPMHMLQDLMNFIGGVMGFGGTAFELKSSIEGVKILQADGTELEGSIVLRDKDQDLAFIRPIQATPDGVKPVNLDAEPAVEAYDPLVVITRLSALADRAVSARFPRISGIIERPRRTYLVGDQAFTEFGAPALTPSGECLGIVVMRRIPSMGVGGGLGARIIGSQQMSNVAAVVVPARDVAEVARQAPPVEAEEPARPEDN